MVHNWKRTASVVYGCAAARLALNMFLHFGELPAGHAGKTDTQKEFDRRYMELSGWYLDGDYVRVLETIDDFRGRIRQEMENVVAYSDALQIYEYVLKRMERRFEDEIDPVEVEGEALTGNLMRYLVSAEDVNLQNQRVREILRQLPVRYTRQKYFSMVHDALTTYIGSDYTGLEEVMYLLRSGSLIEYFRRRNGGYEHLNTVMEQLRAISFKDLTKESYRQARNQVEEAGEGLLALSERFSSLQEMVNDLYLLCLTGRDAVHDAAEEQSVRAILEGLRDQFEQGDPDISDELSDLLPRLEGVQEEYYEKYQRLSFRQEEPGQGDETDRLAAKVEILMSTSPFAALEDSTGQGSVTREDMEKVAAQFFAELEPVFASCQKPVVRAIMATTLSYLPISFHSPDELQSHIRNSLECCTDPTEKATCMELLLQMMEMDGYELV